MKIKKFTNSFAAHLLFSKCSPIKITNLNQLFQTALVNKNLMFFNTAKQSFKSNISLNTQIFSKFSSQKLSPIKPQQIPPENLQIVQTEQKLQNQQVDVYHAKGTLSIMDKVPGGKATESGDLYVLMFTCGQCNAKQIKSFTKNAYHKGVVLVRCEGCDKIHLVADNLGWFQDEVTNVETLHKGKVQKVHDQAAISMFLQKAFGDQKQLLAKDQQNKQDKSKEDQPKLL